MRRGLKTRLSKDETSSEETEKYKIRIPGGNDKKSRGTPNKQTRERRKLVYGSCRTYIYTTRYGKHI